MIYENSRYDGTCPVITVNNKRTIYFDASNVPRDISFITYICSDGDRIDQLAYLFLGDPELWTEIAQINPDIFFYPDTLPIGTAIRIPKF